MRARAVALVLLIAGCGADHVLVAPPSTTTQSAILVARSQPAFGFALEISEGAGGLIELPPHAEGAELLLNLYQCSLEALELVPGPMALRASSGRSFPEANASYRWHERDGESWAPFAPKTFGPTLESIRLDEDEAPPCNDFPLVSEAKLGTLPPQSMPERFVGLESGGGLLSVPDGLYWVEPDASLRPLVDPLFEGPDAAVSFGDRDEVLIVPSAGPMVVGHPERGLRIFGPGPPNAASAMMLARSPIRAANFELFVLGPSGLARFDGVSWSMLDETTRNFINHTRLRGVWIRSGEAVFLPPDQDRDAALLHWRRDQLVSIPLADFPRSLALGHDGLIYVGTENGMLLLLDPDRPDSFSRIEGWSRPTRPLSVVLPLEASILVSGWPGALNEYIPGQGYCSADGFTPDLSGATLVDADLVGTEGEILGVGVTGGTETMTRLVLAKFGRSSARPTRCPDE